MPPSITNVLMTGNAGDTQNKYAPPPCQEACTAGTPSSGTLRVTERGQGHIRQIVVELSSVPISTTDATTSGAYGSQKLFDLPAHAALVTGGTGRLSVTAASGIGATGTVKYSAGSAAETSDDTLNSTQADVIPSTSITLASSAGSAASTIFTATPVVLDSRSSTKSLFVNIGVPDASSTANSTVTVTGVLVFNVQIIPAVAA